MQYNECFGCILGCVIRPKKSSSIFLHILCCLRVEEFTPYLGFSMIIYYTFEKELLVHAPKPCLRFLVWIINLKSLKWTISDILSVFRGLY